ncbi:cell growth-regulating nucleolar protein [Aplochiton taeniatus]
MVFFTCNACGESLKKVQVEKHVNMCRGCQVLSCIDCGKDFWGDDYKTHIKCITEDQKYGGKGYEAKSNKGDVKQQQWIQKIHDAMNKPGISPKLKDVLNQVSSFDNIPRKKVKFQNWMSNSLRITNPTLQNQVWDIFSAATSNAPEPAKQKAPHPPAAEIKAETNGNHQSNPDCEAVELAPEKKKLNKRERKEARQKKNGKNKKCPEDNITEEEEETTQMKNKKRKRNTEDDAEQNGDNTVEEEVTSKKKKRCNKDSSEDVQIKEKTKEADPEVSRGKFNWKGTVKAVLRQSPDEELSVKKLRKKVLAAYYSFSGERNFKSEEDLFALFNKKIKSNPKFRVLKDKVRLIQ